MTNHAARHRFLEKAKSRGALLELISRLSREFRVKKQGVRSIFRLGEQGTERFACIRRNRLL